MPENATDLDPNHLETLAEKLPALDVVRRSFGKTNFEQGRKWWIEGRVDLDRVIESSVEGTVRAEVEYKCGWHFGRNGFLLQCTCRRYAYCPHQVALYLAVASAIGAKSGSSPPQDPDFAPPAADAAPRRRTAEPLLRLSLEEGGLTLKGELRSLAGDCTWPVDGITTTSPDGEFSCDPELMREVAQSLAQAGFEAGKRPGRYVLANTASLDAFLESTLPHWKKEGWRILLDSNLRALLEGGRQVRSSIQLNPSSRDDAVECTWSLDANGQPISSPDLRRLRLFQGRYFRLQNGQVVSVQPGRIKKQVEELVQIGYSPLQPGPQLVKKHFFSRAAALAGEADVAKVSGGLEGLRRKLDTFAADSNLVCPEKLEPILREYQRRGLQFLQFLSENGFGGVLADDMGLGKTLQTLALLELQRQRRGSHASLVVCPTSVAPNWTEECQRFTPELRAIHIQGGRDLELCDFENWDLVVVSYGLIQKRAIDFCFRFLILDEAQQIKNPQAKRTRSAKTIRSQHRLALTGTPIENSLAELWSLFDFLMPGFLGAQTHFERRYRRPLDRDPCDQRTMEELVRKVRPFILRRLKSEVASELPPKSEQDIRCQMAPRQKRLYREIVAAMRGRIELEIARHGWEKSRVNILAALLRLRQICCHPGLIGPEYERFGSGKLEAFLELTESVVAAGGRIVVFSQFVRMLKILAAALHKRAIPWLYLDGSSRDRGEVVKRFQEEARHPVFLVSLKAGGTGLNLTAADYVLLYDPWWNPAVENQAIDRIHRIGQFKPVTAYRLIACGTIEERMLELKKRKQDLADRLLDSQGPDFQSLTREDLELLLSDADA